MSDLVRVSVVIPVYRSAATIERLVTELAGILEENDEAILVDDASPDDSWSQLKAARSRYPEKVRVVRLVRNSGQHNATLCGLSLARGDVVVTMDDDLQHAPQDVRRLVDVVAQGFDLAIASYGRKEHARGRNLGGAIVDRVIRRMYGLPRNFSLTSFRAIKRPVVDNVTRMSSPFPYLTCMLLTQASRYTNVEVDHQPRLVGRTNYSLRKSLSLAASLLLNYSLLPVQLFAGVAFIGSVFAVGFALAVLIRAIIYGSSVPGWVSSVMISSLFSALVLVCLLVVLLYVARIAQQLTGSRVAFTVAEIDG